MVQAAEKPGPAQQAEEVSGSEVAGRLQQSVRLTTNNQTVFSASYHHSGSKNRAGAFSRKQV